MRKIAGLSVVTVFILLSTFQFGTSSCKKTNTVTVYDTVVTVKHDTITKKDTTLSVQLLTANSWKLKELRGVSNNTVTYYLRGGSSNTQSFDNEYITFKSDKTGTYVDNVGTSSTLTWDFGSSDSTKIIFTVQFPSLPTTITWDYIVYKNATLQYDEYFTQNSVNFHLQGTRMVK